METTDPEAQLVPGFEVTTGFANEAGFTVIVTEVLVVLAMPE